MKIGVLSDTHGEIGIVERASRILREQGISLSIHCGDIGDDVVPLLEGLTTHFVYGNVDDRSCRARCRTSGAAWWQGGRIFPPLRPVRPRPGGARRSIRVPKRFPQ